MRRVSFVLMGIGLGLMALASVPRAPKLLYNPSPSAPVGWYLVKPQIDYSVGDLVDVRLPEAMAHMAVSRGYLPKDTPIIKTIAAGPGDEFCVRDRSLFAKPDWQVKIRLTDSQGREMPMVREGCRRLSDGEYLVLSDRVEQSFDSRYFGPVGVQDILGIAVYVSEDSHVDDSGISGNGWVRAICAQGKIKENGAAWPLTPCLHINSYGAVRSAAAPLFAAIPNIYCRAEPRHHLPPYSAGGKVAQ